MTKKQKLYQELWNEAETRGLLTGEIRDLLDDVENLHCKIYTLRQKIDMDRIKAELFRVKKEKDQIKAENDQIEAEIFREKKEKDQLNSQLKAENAARDDDEMADLRRASLEQTYLDTKKHFWLPPVNLNEAVTPSVLGKSRKINYYDKSKQKQVQGRLRIPQAKIVVRTGHHVHPVDVRIPVQVENQLIPSILGAERYGEPFGFDYYNECGVQWFCVSMIKDACRCLSLRDVRSDTEPSIFLIKPDSVVVLRLKGKIVMAILVKSPDVPDGSRNDKVFTSESTSGQIWSYLLAMRSAGIQQPLAAVMTYNKMVLASLDSFENDTAHTEILENVKQTLSTNKAPPYRVHQVPEESQEQTASPIRQTLPVSHVKQDADDTEKEACRDKEVDRVVYYSEVFENGHVFPFLLQAIEMAYQKVGPIFATDIPRIGHGECLGNRVVCKMGKNLFTWVKTPLYTMRGKKKKAFTANLQDFPDPLSQTFYLLGELGVGIHASVMLACNSSGRVCALKCYHVYPSQLRTNRDREEDENEEIESLRDVANAEADRWRLLYQDRFPHVTVVDLAGRPCLVMPYGTQVQDRDSITQELEKELYRLAQRGFRYENNYNRWRNVLVDSQGQVFLSGLGSLEEHGEDTTVPDKLQAMVDKQLAILMKEKQESPVDSV